MLSIKTKIHLPPGAVGANARWELTALLFGCAPIFAPVKYGRIDGDTSLDTKDSVKTLVDFWGEYGRLTVTGKPTSQYIAIMPNRGDAHDWTGSIVWNMPLKGVSDLWREIHAQKVAAAMKLLKSPLAYAALEDDLESKCWQWVEDPIGGERKQQTLAAPAEGIPGMFWRLFVGPGIVNEFADLNEIDSGSATDLDDEFWLMSPYSDPAAAQTPEGKTAEAALIEQLGADVFYDHATQTPPARQPQLNV